MLVSAAGISIEHQRNEPVLRAMEMLDDVLILGTGWMATRWAGLAGAPGRGGRSCGSSRTVPTSCRRR